MELTRYWRATYKGSQIEVQWTGFRFQDGWMLRLFIDGELKAERHVVKFVRNLEVASGPVTVNFWGKMFRHRCTISAEGKVLTDSTQPWNPLAFTLVFSTLGLALIIAILQSISR
jgi:hypothetical protein